MIIDLSYTDSVTLWTSIFKVSIFLSETELTRMTQNHAMLSRQLTIFSSNLRCLCVALAPVGETSRDLGNGIARGIGDSPFGVSESIPRETATRHVFLLML